jgi:hypothetical protein
VGQTRIGDLGVPSLLVATPRWAGWSGRCGCAAPPRLAQSETPAQIVNEILSAGTIQEQQNAAYIVTASVQNYRPQYGSRT